MSRGGYSTIDALAGRPSDISLSPQVRIRHVDDAHADVAVGGCAARRWMLVTFAFVAVAINYSDRTNISVAIITMADEFGWSNTDKGWVLSSFLIGYLISGIPGGFLCNRFGGKHVMSAAALLWSLFTVLTPIAARSSYSALIACRILLGAAEGLAWPAVHQLIPQWFPTDELGRAVSIFTSGSYFGTVITLFMSPPMITAYGWPSVFYFFGSLGFGFVLVWNWKITETPAEQSSISHDELVYIETHSQRASHSAPTHIPWSLLFTSKQLWAFYLNLFASGWSFYVLLAWMPQYFKDALHVDFDSIGFMTLAPYFFQGACAIGSGFLSQHLVSRELVTAEKACYIMQLIGLVGPSVFLLLLGYTPINTTLAVIYLTAALSLNAFTCAGVSVYHQFLVPRLSGLVFSIGNTCSIIPGVIGIVVAGSILDATQSWSLIFLLGIMCFVAGAVVWVCMAHGRPENLDAWTLEESRLTPHQGSI